ncbi:hypothetical protein B0H14DRAFT_2557587 [Mycena olivaceomarginata]|nr:hypothetical protein B0H14DRAFT_2557587 [Mycena olivaceomarginata]
MCLASVFSWLPLMLCCRLAPVLAKQPGAGQMEESKLLKVSVEALQRECGQPPGQGRLKLWKQCGPLRAAVRMTQIVIDANGERVWSRTELAGRDPKEGLQTQKETSGIASSSVFLVKDGLRGIVANLGAILEARICEDKVETEELCGGGKMMRKKLKDSD